MIRRLTMTTMRSLRDLAPSAPLPPDVVRRYRDRDTVDFTTEAAQRTMPRRCNSRLVVPNGQLGDLTFTCARSAHGGAGKGDAKGKIEFEGGDPHRENGRIRRPDGSVRIYEIQWWDEFQREVWRQP